MSLIETSMIEPGSVSAKPRVSLSEPKDFLALLKPRVMSLVVLTAVTGMVAAPGTMNPVLAIVSILAIAVGAGASGALNMWYDADIDARMSRTKLRPVPSGRVEPDAALAFGLGLSIFSVMVLGLAANWFAAAFLAFTIFFYAVIYTMGLKRSTPQNIVIGGAAGAFPPMIGWAAVTGDMSLAGFVLFMIIFLWTPPHFWALALFKMKEYGSVGVPMLPNVAGEASTRRQIFAYSLILVPVGVAPFFLGFAGPVYGVVAALMGANFLRHAYAVLKMADGDEKMIPAKRLFGFSILYLFGLFITLLGETVVIRLLAGGAA
ncbi:protoheme IX farnesyltransferase [Fulvimarina manganoxydans]|uniref:Protoheme IX farnesyltransferase n=2 Tax=Fulvimarina manganoxydans TaxID=937218 RepID=A0A1W2EE69_9HYPH|nr:heme o synthase [Fulvimarina manganoxydans]SMD07692.1 protoheme IX farnesyltransferase [Fulvimarina manganoxydans]